MLHSFNLKSYRLSFFYTAYHIDYNHTFFFINQNNNPYK